MNCFFNKILICGIEPEVPEVGYSEEILKLHDAGYDAYLTSTVFVNLCDLYGEFAQQFIIAVVHYVFIYNK